MIQWNDFPKCPHCKTIDIDWYDGLEPKWDGDEWTTDCGDCGKEYVVTMNVTATFQTKVTK